MAEEFVGVNELERRFGLPASWWYSQAEAGAVPSYKIGKYRRFLVSEVVAHLHSLRQGPAVDATRSSR